MEGTVGSGRPARVPEAILREGTRASVGAGPEKCRLFQNKLEMEMTPPNPAVIPAECGHRGPQAPAAPAAVGSLPLRHRQGLNLEALLLCGSGLGLAAMKLVLPGAAALLPEAAPGQSSAEDAGPQGSSGGEDGSS